ncbi:MAG TPA: peptidyl prolyl 4-hydroxylase subunit alpha, partial [Allosphingosinicella sp.]
MLAASGRVEEAVLLLGKLAATGNGEALFKLAQWRTEGQLLPRDLGLARDLYRRAGAAGSIGGATAYLAFLCTGVGGPRDWPNGLALLRLLAARDVEARRQLDIVEKMSISGEGDPLSLPKPEILSPQPHASMIPGLLSAAECDYLIETAEPLFWRSLTVDEKTGRQFVNPIRTSEAAAFP